MADTYTPNFSWTLCEVGASRDTWGSKLNANLTSIDQFVAFACPIGIIADFAGPTAPAGWLLCDGRTISRTTYSALFAAIGTYWGAGDGSTTFALPNMNGRAAIGTGPFTAADGGSWGGYSFTQALGLVQAPITQANLPNYNLVTDVQGYHSHSGATAPGGNHNHSADSQGSHSHSGNTGIPNTQHTHSGTTDTQGNHVHSVTSRVASPAGGTTGAYQIYGGGFGWDGAGTDAQGNHAHNFTTGVESLSHYHSIVIDGAHSHNIGYSGNLQLGIYGDGNHQHNVALGGGGVAMSLMQPVLVVTKIIYAGSQAAPATASTSATTPSPAATELDELRGEIAELRALLLAPHAVPRRRTLSSPLRGVH